MCACDRTEYVRVYLVSCMRMIGRWTDSDHLEMNVLYRCKWFLFLHIYFFFHLESNFHYTSHTLFIMLLCSSCCLFLPIEFDRIYDVSLGKCYSMVFVIVLCAHTYISLLWLFSPCCICYAFQSHRVKFKTANFFVCLQCFYTIHFDSISYQSLWWSQGNTENIRPFEWKKENEKMSDQVNATNLT